MTTVTFRNGTTVSDGSDSATTLRNGGHRTRFVPALVGTVEAAAEAKNWASLLGSVVYDSEYSAKEYAVGTTCPSGSAKSWASSDNVVAGGLYSAKYYMQQAQTFSNSAINAPGTSATSTTSLTIGTGSKTFAIQTGKAFSVGQFVIASDQTTPANYMVGQVTAHNITTGSLTVNVTVTGGSGTLANWIISLTALANAAGAATLGGNNIYSGTNTYSALTTFNGNVVVNGTIAFNSTCTFNQALTVYEATGNASATVRTDDTTAGNYANYNLYAGSSIYTVRAYGLDNSFSLYDVVNLREFLKYTPSTGVTVLNKPQRTDAATSANDLVRKAELDNASVQSIVTTTQGALSGFRNVIVNGNMLVRQRSQQGVIPGNSTTTSGVYGPTDRWYVSANTSSQITLDNADVTDTRVASLTFNTTTPLELPSTFFVSGFSTKIEAQDLINMVRLGKTCTLSFLFSGPTSGTYSVKIRHLLSNLECIRTFSYSGAPSYQSISVVFPAFVFAMEGNISNSWGFEVTIGGFGGASYSKSAQDSTWTTGTSAVGVSGSVNWGLDFGQIKRIRVSRVQLEEGPVATPFEQRPYQVELAMCQRYYETGSCKVYAAGATSISTAVNYRVPKRVAVTPTYSTATGRSLVPTSTEWAEVDSFGANRSGAELAFVWTASAE